MMYHSIASRLDEDGKLKLDAILGDPAALAETEKRRGESVVSAGFEVA
jgi:hypothetical protein